MKKTYKLFYAGLLLPVILFAAYFFICARLLTGAGEYLGMDETVGKISETYGYYGSALKQRTFHFKQSLYRRLKPEIAVLGSSRVLQFRGETFRVPFANIGGMSGLDEVDEIARALFPDHPPRVLILGVDFWWFNPANENAKPLRSPEEATMSVADLLMPPAWLASGKMTLLQAKTLVGGDIADVGISAYLRRDGFDRYGAYYYTSLWNGSRESEDKNFKDSLSRAERSASVFIHGDAVSQERLAKFGALLDFLSERGIKTVLFLPPFAPTVLDSLLKDGKHTYMPLAEQKIRAVAKKHGLPVHDYHDLRAIESGDCEFTDGIHAGQIATDRMLLRLAIEDADVRKTVDLPAVAREITRGKDHASTLSDETDFLGLGCAKPAGG